MKYEGRLELWLRTDDPSRNCRRHFFLYQSKYKLTHSYIQTLKPNNVDHCQEMGKWNHE